jgi:abhydrolase domain-containing protein 6
VKPGKRRLRIASAALFFCLAAFVAIGLLRPEWVLEGEYARLRWLAGASERSVRVGDHRIVYLQAGAAAPYGGGAATHSAAHRSYAPPTLVVGHSMGGQILGLLAAQHPDAVNRIALMDAAGVPFEANAFGRAVLAGSNPFEVRTRAQLHRYLRVVFNDDAPWVPWPADAALARMRARQAGFEQAVLDRIGRGPEALLLGTLLGRVQSPTLLLWCRDDGVIDASAAAVFHAGLRNSSVVLFDHCGHMPMMVKPDQTAAALEGFVRRSAGPKAY